MTDCEKDSTINQNNDIKHQRSTDIRRFNLTSNDYFVSYLTAQISNIDNRNRSKSQNPPKSCDVLEEVESTQKLMEEKIIMQQIESFQNFINQTLSGDKFSFPNMLGSFPHASLLEDKSNPPKKEILEFNSGNIGFQKYIPKLSIDQFQSFESSSSLEMENNDLNEEEKVFSDHSDDLEEDKQNIKSNRNSELSQRRDVVYKTIIRDMRKYYIEDFNNCTGYVKKKRYRRKDFYLTCVNEYINEPHIKTSSLRHGRPIKDFNIYCGALIYPKELEKIITKKPQK